MAGKNADRIQETSTTTGTGNFTLAGAVTGYRTFNSVFSTSNQFAYCIEAVDGDGVPSGAWEVGRGYLTDSTTMVRDTIMSSSNSDAVVNFAAGTKNVFNPFSGLAARKSTHGFDLQYGMP